MFINLRCKSDCLWRGIMSTCHPLAWFVSFESDILARYFGFEGICVHGISLAVVLTA